MRYLIALAALALAACGGSETPSAPSRAAPTLSVKRIDGVGSVLVDGSGKALYTPDEERSGKVVCVDECLTFWDPLQPGSRTPTAGGDVSGKLGVISRDDGSQQVTLDGRPLYRFSEDPAPGRVTGDGFEDDFAGTHFTWHAVTTSGTSSAPARDY
jgi:predicted lipoprotein with Yx(FWY)xxD motif